MGKREHYQARDPGLEHFIADSLPEALEDVAGWLRNNPHVSVLAIHTTPDDDSESVAVFYEC